MARISNVPVRINNLTADDDDRRAIGFRVRRKRRVIFYRTTRLDSTLSDVVRTE